MKEFRVATPTGGVALSAATVKTALQIVAGTNNQTQLDWIDVSFNGVSPTNEPVEVTVMKQTTAPGTPGTAPTIEEMPPTAIGTLQATAATGGGTEPTSSTIMWRGFVHPQAGKLLPGPFYINGGERLGVVVLAVDAVDAQVSAKGRE